MWFKVEKWTDEQVKVLFQGYCQGQLARTDLQDLLGIEGVADHHH